MIMKKTNGLGVDFVLSSSTKNQMDAHIKHLSEDGTFLAIEPSDLQKISHLNQKLFEKGIACKSIFLDKLAKKPSVRKYLTEIINQDLRLGVIRPLPATIFKPNEIETAFRSVSLSKLANKVVIQIPDSSDVANLEIKTKFVANKKSVYIITGGLGGFGLELTNWIILRGARNLVLAVRRRALTPYEQHRIKLVEIISLLNFIFCERID